MNTWTLQTRRNSSMSPLPVAYVSDCVIAVSFHIMQGPHYNTLSCLTTTKTWYAIDITYYRTIDGQVLSKFQVILNSMCGTLAKVFHVVLVAPQSLKSLRKNIMHAKCSIGTIMERNLQVDRKTKNSENNIRIITTNKHESGISEDFTTSITFWVANHSLNCATGRRPARKASTLKWE